MPPPTLPRVLHPSLSQPLSLLLLPPLLLLILPLSLSFQSLKYYTLGPPHPNFSLRRVLLSTAVTAFFRTSNFFGVKAEDAGARKVGRFGRKGMEVVVVPVPPIPASLRIGMAVCPAVEAVEVGGFMVNPPAAAGVVPYGQGIEKAREGEKIILYLVGGGYVSGHPLLTHLVWSVSKHLQTRVFSVNYRKSLSAGTAFPACLIDALAGYQYLLTLGFLPQNIILMGDSAGGNLALALSLYLGELEVEGKGVGMVGGMVLFSPWCDMTASGESHKPSHPASRLDYAPAVGASSVPLHTRHYPTLIASPYFSPSLPSSSGAPRFAHLQRAGVKVYVQVGDCEVLYSEGVQLVEGMKAEGVEVVLRVIEGGIHDEVVFDILPTWRVPTKKDLTEFWGTV